MAHEYYVPYPGPNSFHKDLHNSLGSAGELQDLFVALEELWLGFEQALDDVLHKLAGLILELFLRRAQDFLKDNNELWCQALDGGLIGLV